MNKDSKEVNRTPGIKYKQPISSPKSRPNTGPSRIRKADGTFYPIGYKGALKEGEVLLEYAAWIVIMYATDPSSFDETYYEDDTSKRDSYTSGYSDSDSSSDSYSSSDNYSSSDSSWD